jgi:hypothetical protein
VKNVVFWDVPPCGHTTLGLDTSGSRQGPVAGSVEHGNELPFHRERRGISRQSNNYTLELRTWNMQHTSLLHLVHRLRAAAAGWGWETAALILLTTRLSSRLHLGLDFH